MDHRIQYMKQCIALGKQAMLKGDSPVGSILVKNDEIIGIGIESGKSSKDVTRHAEIEAINNAIKIGNLKAIKGSVLYTTHEPCIMCSYVIRHHKIDTVVYGIASEHVGGFTSEFKILSTETVPKWGKAPHIIGGFLEDECKELSEGYVNIQNKKQQ